MEKGKGVDLVILRIVRMVMFPESCGSLRACSLQNWTFLRMTFFACAHNKQMDAEGFALQVFVGFKRHFVCAGGTPKNSLSLEDLTTNIWVWEIWVGATHGYLFLRAGNGYASIPIFSVVIIVGGAYRK